MRQEIKKMLPVMNKVIDQFPQYRFIICGVGSLPKSMYHSQRAEIVIDKTYEILSIAKSAIVTSGTATLETALWNVPQVVGYITGPMTYAIGSRLVDVKYFSLVNLILNREVVLELLQSGCTPESIGSELQTLTEDTPRRASVLNGYKELRKILGEESVSRTTAGLMIKYLQ